MASTVRSFAVLALTAFVGISSAQSCSGGAQQYNSATNYGQPNQCIPSGYYQAQDFGNTSPAALKTQCASLCASYGAQCGGYAGKLMKAADSDLYSGQCYFYTALPLNPASCADYPSVLFAEAKDNTNACFASSAAVATPYCSSLLGIGKKTVYTSTFTPTRTITSKPVSTISTTSTSISTSVSVATPYLTITETTTATQLSTATITSYTFAPGLVRRSELDRRQAVRANAPACLNTQSIPLSRISSACSCLSIVSATVSTPTQAPTATTRTTTTVTSITSFSTKTTTLTTSTTISTTTSTSTTTVTQVVATATAFASTTNFMLVDNSGAQPVYPRVIISQTFSSISMRITTDKTLAPVCQIAQNRALVCNGKYPAISGSNYILYAGPADHSVSGNTIVGALFCDITGADFSLKCDPINYTFGGTMPNTFYYDTAPNSGYLYYDVSGRTSNPAYGYPYTNVNFKAVPAPP